MPTAHTLNVAKAILVAISASAGMPASFADDEIAVWLPERSPSSPKKIIDRLAAAAMPLCGVGVASQRCLHVGVWAFHDEVPLAEDMLRFAQSLAQGADGDFPTDELNVVVEAEAGGSTAQLTWPEYVEWQTRCFFPTATIALSAPKERPNHLIARVAPVGDGEITGHSFGQSTT